MLVSLFACCWLPFVTLCRQWLFFFCGIQIFVMSKSCLPLPTNRIPSLASQVRLLPSTRRPRVPQRIVRILVLMWANWWERSPPPFVPAPPRSPPLPPILPRFPPRLHPVSARVSLFPPVFPAMWQLRFCWQWNPPTPAVGCPPIAIQLCALILSWPLDSLDFPQF